MSTSLPSLMTRKRQIPGSRVFDTSKVIADYNSTTSTPHSYYRQTFIHSAPDTKPLAGIVNKPSPNDVCFLFENPRFINEPICLANTKSDRDVQHKWWPEKIPENKRPMPDYSLGSTNRADFKRIQKVPPAQTRFGSNPFIGKASTGIVPVNTVDCASKISEKVSFEHQFNCRKDRTERGKLMGSFVWEKLGPITPEKRVATRRPATEDKCPSPTDSPLQKKQRGISGDLIVRRVVNNGNYKCNDWYYHL